MGVRRWGRRSGGNCDHGRGQRDLKLRHCHSLLHLRAGQPILDGIMTDLYPAALPSTKIEELPPVIVAPELIGVVHQVVREEDDSDADYLARCELDSVTLRFLRRIDAKIDGVIEMQDEHGHRLKLIEAAQDAIRRDQAGDA